VPFWYLTSQTMYLPIAPGEKMELPRHRASTSSGSPTRSPICFLEMIHENNLEKFGGKAVNLARLHSAGVSVPTGFSISSDCFSEFLRGIDHSDEILRRLESTSDVEEIMECAASLERLGSSREMPAKTKESIVEAFSRLSERVGEHDTGYAIRSSANIEDGQHISFAGQAESYLCVNGAENVVESVRRTWQSAISPRAVLYLRSMNVPLNRVKMGVIVQEMVDADVSGVMFTANIVTNDPCQIIIESTWGLGEPLVSGKVIPDTYVLDKNPLRVLQRTLGTKAVVASIAARNQQQGVVLQETPPDKQSTLTLNDVNLLKVAQMGMSVEKILGGPQDIEWCIRDSQLIVLQARPVTTMQQSSYRDKG